MNYTVQNITKMVNMMDLRRNIGAIIDEVIYTNKEVLIHKHGKPVCLLTVVTNGQQNITTCTMSRKRNIEKLYGAIKMTGQETKHWLSQRKDTDQKYDQKIRDAWEKRSV